MTGMTKGCTKCRAIGRECNYCREYREGWTPASKEDPCQELATKYPKYWKPLPKHWAAIDTYRINRLFPIQASDDPSGMVLHARKKLLVPGTRTGGKSFYSDIKEARDTLSGWLAENDPDA